MAVVAIEAETTAVVTAADLAEVMAVEAVEVGNFVPSQ
jgi:hypothetical protein